VILLTSSNVSAAYIELETRNSLQIRLSISGHSTMIMPNA